jgi:hypothetical protein
MGEKLGTVSSRSLRAGQLGTLPDPAGAAEPLLGLPLLESPIRSMT